MFKQTLYVIALVVVLAVIGAFGYAVFKTLKTAPVGTPVGAPAASSTISASPADAVNDITVTNPLPGALVESPLRVTGEAVGTWYFEASFPVVITDGDGLILGQTPAQALSDWMTTSSVPFEATLNFNVPRTANGFLILKNDNPSGDPARQRFIEIPVRFR